MQPFVLIVASDPLCVENLSEILAGYGVRTISSLHTSTALGILHAIKIDLVVFKANNSVAQWQPFVNAARGVQPRLKVLVFGEDLPAPPVQTADDIIFITNFSKDKLKSAISKIVNTIN